MQLSSNLNSNYSISPGVSTSLVARLWQILPKIYTLIQRGIFSVRISSTTQVARNRDVPEFAANCRPRVTDGCSTQGR